MWAWRRSFCTSAVRRYTPSSALSANRIRCAELLNATTTTTTGEGDGKTKAHRYENEEIILQGFIRSVRKQKRFAFAEISDGSTVKSLQAILTPDQAADLSTGTAVEISGIWKACPAGKEQTHELQTSKIRIVGDADAETYPIQKKYHSPDFLRQIPHLRLRTPFNSLLARFRSETIYQLGQVFRTVPQGGFVQVQPPLITSSDCEGAGETFTVSPQSSAPNSISPKGTEEEGENLHFFRSPKYLTVSSQLHLEAYAAELGNVWTLSPTFRAEKSKTPRHLSEFYMLEAEVNFTNELPALLDLVEYLIRDLARRLYDTPVAQEVLSAKRTGESGFDDIHEVLRKKWEVVLSESITWPRITYTQAIQMLQEAETKHGASFIYPPSWSEGLQTEHEKYIVDTMFNGIPVFVTDYPANLKPFYMAPSTSADTAPAGQETVACFDLLFPEICEVVGGSLREHRLPELISKMRQYGLIKQDSKQLPQSPAHLHPDSDDVEHMLALSRNYPYLQSGETLGHLQWYADLRRWGSAPHGGFGLGFDRLLGYLAGVGSLRDVVPFPRYFGRADC